MTVLLESSNTRTIPNRLYMKIEDYPAADCAVVAKAAVAKAKELAPKLSGASAAKIRPLWGDGWIGMTWDDNYLWFQEVGIRPFTMRSLAGKTIPMWIDDPTGKVRRENPKAETRVTASGKKQVLIFRRAARMGQRRRVWRGGQQVDVPASYPGAPGRIGVREARAPWTRGGKVGGQIAKFNVGVRWRHPGLSARSFLYAGMVLACEHHNIEPGDVRATTMVWR